MILSRLGLILNCLKLAILLPGHYLRIIFGKNIPARRPGYGNIIPDSRYNRYTCIRVESGKFASGNAVPKISNSRPPFNR